METNNDVTTKTESVKTNLKSGYLVKVIHTLTQKAYFYLLY
jgi:hypothetical protein